ncbi:unnamed protein product [Ambrosiozyma monospora]|uniref:Unnamed protein product n=1 Tax=Ambrosiozyma monospora TaxID=43982 RepID=A0ACB5T2K5_AMBMO|nr:unnamed protein product [Ambrosiozyma monospora]
MINQTNHNPPPHQLISNFNYPQFINTTTNQTNRKMARPDIPIPETPQPPYPLLFANTTVIPGFGRGSSEIGIPTANVPITSFSQLDDIPETGVYFGYVKIHKNKKKNKDKSNGGVKKGDDKASVDGRDANVKGDGEGEGEGEANREDKKQERKIVDRIDGKSQVELTYSDLLSSSNGDFDVLPMVLSIGWNPFFKNKQKACELHVMHKFAGPFYGADLSFIVLGYIRPELDYVSLELLIRDINLDIEIALMYLKKEGYVKFKSLLSDLEKGDE